MHFFFIYCSLIYYIVLSKLYFSFCCLLACGLKQFRLGVFIYRNEILLRLLSIIYDGNKIQMLPVYWDNKHKTVTGAEGKNVMTKRLVEFFIMIIKGCFPKTTKLEYENRYDVNGNVILPS